jgi:hypothetical protein
MRWGANAGSRRVSTYVQINGATYSGLGKLLKRLSQ